MKHQFNLIVFLMLSGISLTACKPHEPDIATEEPAQITPTPQIESVNPVVRNWDDARVEVLCLSFTGETSGVDEEVDWNVAGPLGDLFASLGITVVEPGDDCDALLDIRLAGYAASAQYGDSRCYTGASVVGSMTLTRVDMPPIELESEGLVSMPAWITGCPENPSMAPFDEASYLAIIDGLYRIWGDAVLLPALDSPFAVGAARIFKDMGERAYPLLVSALYGENMRVVMEATVLMAGIAPESTAAQDTVPHLIQFMMDDPVSAPIAVQPLEAITGLAFGDDIEAWLSWWESQPQQ